MVWNPKVLLLNKSSQNTPLNQKLQSSHTQIDLKPEGLLNQKLNSKHTLIGLKPEGSLNQKLQSSHTQFSLKPKGFLNQKTPVKTHTYWFETQRFT